MNYKSLQNLSAEMIPPSTILILSPTSCTCCAPSSPTTPAGSDPPFLIKTSEFSIKLKEIIILGLIFLLLLYSILTFLSKWSKSYRQINQIPYYSTDQEEQLSPGKKGSESKVKVITPDISAPPWEEVDLSISRTGSRMSRIVQVKTN